MLHLPHVVTLAAGGFPDTAWLWRILYQKLQVTGITNLTKASYKSVTIQNRSFIRTFTDPRQRIGENFKHQKPRSLAV
ncbi:hypothetical protein [Acidocella facilis]|uniref:hypothetical protein n=1 Tax=Acidocella facilis TaxID=525 RepID=UPI001F3E1317|nr:hypothetical protein [Acidocella facilis]